MASNFDIVYRIATDLSGLNKGVQDTATATKQIDEKMTGLQKTVADVGKSLVGLFAAEKIGEEIKALGHEVLSLGSSLTDLRAKTGISLEGLQILKVAAEQNGVSVETLAKAANKLGVALAGGGAGVKDAVDRLGLSFDTLRKQSPEDNLATIAKAMSGVVNPAERAKLATELFGKAGLEILPLLTDEFGRQAEAAKHLGIVISDDALEAADRFDDQMIVLHTTFVKFMADVLTPLLPGLFALARTFAELAGGAITMGRAVSDWVVGTMLKASSAFYSFRLAALEAADKIPFFGKSLSGGTALLAEARETARQAADQVRIFADKTIEARAAVDGHSSELKKTLPILSDFSGDSKKAADEQDKLLKKIREFREPVRDVVLNMSDLAGINKQVDNEAKKLTEDEKKLADAIRAVEHPMTDEVIQMAELEKVGKKVEVTMKDVAKATTSWTGSLLELVHGNFGKGVSDIGGLLKGAIDPGKILNTAIGGAISGGISAAISGAMAGLKALVGFIANIGGPSQAEKDARTAQADLVQQLQKIATEGQKTEGALRDSYHTIAIVARDAFIQTGLSADQAELKVRALLDTHNPQAFTAAMQELNTVLADQVQDAADLDAAIKRYGFSIEELGPAMQKQQLDEQAKQLLNDWRLLVGSGIDVVDVNTRMASTMQSYLDTARATGQEVPSAMRPVIESMINQGLLVDENGDKFQDLASAGITFSETMTQGFDKIAAKLDILIQKLSLGLTSAIENIPDISTDATVNVHYNLDSVPAPDGLSFGSTGGIVDAFGIQSFGSGGLVLPYMARGTDTVPAMLTPGEVVLTAAQARGLAGPGNDPAVRELMIRLPEMIRQAVTAGLAQA